MKKLLALLLAAMMLFSLAACDLGNNETPNDDTPGTAQNGENNNDKGGEENNDAVSVSDVLAKYGLTEDAVKPDETYSEVTASKDAWDFDVVTFSLGGAAADSAAYYTKIFNAISAISDDGKVYSVGSAFTAGTGGDITLDDVKLQAASHQFGYIYNGTKVMLTVSTISNVKLSFGTM